MLQRLAQLTRHSVVYGLGSVASKVLAIFLLPVYVRYLDTVHYGAVETMLVLDLLLAAIVKLGLQNSMMRFWYEEERERARGTMVTATVIWVTGGLAIAVSLAMLAWREGLARELFGVDRYALEAGGSVLVMIAAGHLASTVLWASLTTTYRLEQRPGTYVATAVANVLLTGAFTVGLIVAMGWKAEGLLLGNLLGTAVLVPVVAWQQRRFLRPRFSRELTGAMLRYGLPLAPVAIAMQGLRVIDRFLLQRRFVPASEGLAAVGLYSVGVRFSQVVILVVTALQLSWQPFAYSIRDDDEARRTYAAVMSAYIGFVGWIVATVSMLADPLVRLLTVPQYYDSATVVPLLTLAAMFFGAYFIAAVGAGRAKKTHFNFAVALVAFVVSIVLNWALIPTFGILGAGLAAVGANFALAAGMAIRSHAVFPIPYEWRRIAIGLGWTCVFVAASYVPLGGTLATTMAGVGTFVAFPLLLLASGYARLSQVRRFLQAAVARNRKRDR